LWPPAARRRGVQAVPHLSIRTPPQPVTRPFLDTTERGGVSFVQQSFA
jgi:hypothetical protein